MVTDHPELVTAIAILLAVFCWCVLLLADSTARGELKAMLDRQQRLKGLELEYERPTTRGPVCTHDDRCCKRCLRGVCLFQPMQRPAIYCCHLSAPGPEPRYTDRYRQSSQTPEQSTSTSSPSRPAS